MQEQIHAAMQNLSAYPRWLVATCGVIVAITLLWIAAKVLKWTVYVLLALAMISVVGGAIYWWMGRI